MRKPFYLLLILCAVFLSHILQAQSWNWAINSTGYNFDNTEAMCVDASGNTYIAGEFYYNITFPGGPTLTSTDADLYVAKINPSGTCLWAQKIVLSVNGQEINDIAVNNTTGECFVTGWFFGTATIGTLPVLTSAGARDIFAAKYNSTTGAPIWSKRLGNTLDNTFSTITSDASGNSYVTGDINGSITIAPLGTVSGNMFVVKLGPAVGTAQWVRAITTTTVATLTVADIRTDASGGCYLSGSLSSTLTTPGLTLTPTTGKTAAYLIKLNTSNGNVTWGTNTTVGNAYGTAMDVDVSNNIVIGGTSETTAVFSGTTVTSGSGNGPAYLAKYSTAGVLSWAKQIPSTDEVADLDTDCQSNIYILGDQVFAKKYTASGSAVWSLNGSTNIASSDEGGIGVDQLGNVYVGGSFEVTATFGSTTLTATSVGDRHEAYLAKITFVKPIVNNATICLNSGSVTLTVTNPLIDYTYNWYTAATGGTLLGTGSSYTTPTINTTTIYYLDASSSTNCQTLSRIAVTVTVNNSCCPSFIAPVVSNVHVCSSGTATFTVNNIQSGYLYNWYTTSTGGSPFTTGTTYTTGTLSTPYTATYYVEAANSTTCPASSRVATTVTVDNCCLQVTMPTTQQNPVMGTDVYYSITITNQGTSNVTISSLSSITSTPDLNVTSADHNFPLVVTPTTPITVIVLGSYSSFSTTTTPFDKCFSLVVGSCNYQVCQPTLVLDPLGIGDADFTINSNNVPIRTSQAINFTGDNPGSSTTNYWYVKPAGGSYTLLSGSGNTVSYAFPDLGNYYVQHNFGSYTLTKAVTVTGENRALNFSTAEISAGTNSNYGIGNFTLEGYIKPTTLPTAANSKACILSNVVSGIGFEFGINASGKLFLFIDGTTYTNTTGTTLVNGTCYHVAVTRATSTNTYTFYVNGVSTGTFTTSTGPSYNEATLFLGRSSYWDTYSYGQYVGLREDVRVWSTTRTASQLSSNIYTTLIGTETGLVSYWPINEDSGTVLHDIVSSNNGTISEQTWTILSCGGAREGNESENATQYQTRGNLNVYPVPFTTETNLTVYSSTDEVVSLSIIDIMGSTVYKADGLSSNTEYTVGKNLTSGIYTVVVRCGEKVEYKKIVKQ